MESSQKNPLLEKEKKKTLKWKTSDSLLRAFDESMLQIKGLHPNMGKKEIGLAVKGMTRAVNDLEFVADRNPADFDEVEFEDFEGENVLVTEARKTTRDNLIKVFGQKTRETSDDADSPVKLDELVESTKVLENHLRLLGHEHIEWIFGLMEPDLLQSRADHSSAGSLVYSLYDFNAWDDQRDRPWDRSDTWFERQQEIEEITQRRLNETFDSFLEDISKQYGEEGFTDPDIIKGIGMASIDMIDRTQVGIVWNELIHMEPDANDVERMRRWLASEDGPKLNKKAESIRVNLRERLYKTFKDVINESRKGRVIRHGAREDVDYFKNGLLYGVRNFRFDLESPGYVDKLKKAKFLSQKDVNAAKLFIDYFEHNNGLTTKFIGTDGRHNMAVEAVVFDDIYDLERYKSYLGIKI